MGERCRNLGLFSPGAIRHGLVASMKRVWGLGTKGKNVLLFFFFCKKELWIYIFCAFRQMTQPWSFVNVWDEKWGGSVGIAALQMNSGTFGQKKDAGLCLDKEPESCIYIISIQQSLSIVFITHSLSIFCLQTNVHSYLLDSWYYRPLRGLFTQKALLHLKT